MDKKNNSTESQEINAEKIYPGAAPDYADDNRVDSEMVKNDVKELNNNPRNNKLDE